MEWAQITTHWDVFEPQLQNRWGRLTDEDVQTARAGRDALIGRITERYGVNPEIVTRHVDDWLKSASVPTTGRAFMSAPSATVGPEPNVGAAPG